MNNAEITQIANHWIALRSNDSLSDSELDWDLPFNKPHLCLDIILNILDKIDPNPKNKIFDILAAGPLEDLLYENGEEIIDRVEILARTNPVFRTLLNGVWDGEMDKDLKDRLSKYMVNKW